MKPCIHTLIYCPFAGMRAEHTEMSKLQVGGACGFDGGRRGNNYPLTYWLRALGARGSSRFVNPIWLIVVGASAATWLHASRLGAVACRARAGAMPRSGV